MLCQICYNTTQYLVGSRASGLTRYCAFSLLIFFLTILGPLATRSSLYIYKFVTFLELPDFDRPGPVWSYFHFLRPSYNIIWPADFVFNGLFYLHSMISITYPTSSPMAPFPISTLQLIRIREIQLPRSRVTNLSFSLYSSYYLYCTAGQKSLCGSRDRKRKNIKRV